MSNDIYQKDSYKELVIKNSFNTIDFLLKENLDFAIICHTKIIEFNPEIPSSVAEFEDSVIFLIAGYSKESANVTKNHLIFEAGFGESNFGSVVTVPLEAIIQIVLKEDILTINYYEPKENIPNQEDISLQSLLNNPENQKLIKKRVTKK